MAGHALTLHVNDGARTTSRRAGGLKLVSDQGRTTDQFYAGVLALADALVAEAERIRANPCDREPTVWVNIPAGYSVDQHGEAFALLRQRGYAILPTSLSGPINSIYLTVPNP